jgi:Arc/MetJ-type ribon-helix-helix transcriptional regulator
MAQQKVTIKIPRVLYERIKVLIEGSGFDSVTDFIVYVLRDLVGTTLRRDKAEEAENLTGEEIDAIRKRLRSLGYLD